ncbi:hypothetical protein M8A51_02135 [Schlegelella sp. S2-27]|uniref:Uncharacterized protein n=1 Tax=Caldimonas mangrovi TaxID=2944811 RepID=A0ABT0YHX1_9BURK|nr:hypothetical protein [Caldimonas mangrovi]MCM5678324.1 hypothetical protein [Caldimonas mangrovi]
MVLFNSKKGAPAARGGIASSRARVDAGFSASPPDARERRSWMDSSLDLKQGLDVIELDELPDELFGSLPASQ